MVTIISGTNRLGNMTIHVSNAILELLTNDGIEAQVLDLTGLEASFISHNEAFGSASDDFTALVTTYVQNAEKFVFVVPEYNGSYPGICKAFIDCVQPARFRGKRAAIVGLAAGRAGNLRGTDHLTGVLNYLNMEVVPKHTHLIHIDAMLEEGRLVDEHAVNMLQSQLKAL